MKRVFAYLALAALAAGAMGCTMTQKVASGVGVGAVRRGVCGAVAGGVAVPVAMAD